MIVKVRKSPDPLKKFRVTLENGKTVDFCARGYSYYTKHKNSSRMRLYVQRHGGQVPSKILKEKDSKKIHREMLKVKTSDKEIWSIRGIDTAGFWSRWYLWSYPNLEDVKRYMSIRFNIKFN